MARSQVNPQDVSTDILDQFIGPCGEEPDILICCGAKELVTTAGYPPWVSYYFISEKGCLEGTSEIFEKNKVQREKWPVPSNGPPCNKNSFFKFALKDVAAL